MATVAHENDLAGAASVVQLMDRRRALRFVGGAGALAFLAACGRSGDDSGASADTTTSTSVTSTTASVAGGVACQEIPNETAGPFPGDGSNGPNVLSDPAAVRSDIRSSFGSSTTTAEGVLLTIKLKIVDLTNGCTAFPGAAVYLWHCDRGGGYSMYSDGITGENYLRGVQEADADGMVTFTSIFPGAYTGRWPHIHFEVYSSLADATGGGGVRATSQLALPEDTCRTVYETAGYEASVSNLAQSSLASDMVFADGYSQQLAAMTGDAARGYTATLTVPV